MPIDVLMPQLSPTMTEGRLANWLKAVGDKVSAGDVIAEVETDKATMEVEASDDGILHMIIGKPGEDLPVGAPIAVLKGATEDVPADYKPVGKAKPTSTGDVTPAAVGEVSVETPASTQTHETVAHHPIMASAILPKINTSGAKAGPAKAMAMGHNDRVKASPLARRLAKEKGVDLSALVGTGPHGRIVASDVSHAPAGGFGGRRMVMRRADNVIKLTPMRKAIASRLLASKQTVPHFYLNVAVRMDALMALRVQLNDHFASLTPKDQKPMKLTVNDFILKACAMGLAEHPKANAAWNGDSVVEFGNVDVSVAVAIDGGLITPIVENADQKSLVQISGEVKDLVAAAKAGKLKPEQYEGGSFSLSNLGMFGIDNFNAIVNPPQAAILAVGTTNETVVVDNGTMKPANVMNATLSVDHRVIDGALGAELLTSIRKYLENPALMLL